MASTHAPSEVLGHGTPNYGGTTSGYGYMHSGLNASESNILPINYTHITDIPWHFGPQAYLDGVAFWYRPDQSDSMPRHHILKHGPNGSAGVESVKHRRTRNGCFTCRNRRVKCDEARPICDRCRKGNRSCEFPPPAKKSKRKPRISGNRTGSRNGGGPPEGDEEGSKTGEDVDIGDERLPDAADTSRHTSPGTATEKDDDLIPTQPPYPDSECNVKVKKEKNNNSPSTDDWESVSASVTPPSSLQSGGTLNFSTTLSAPEFTVRPGRWSHLSSDMQECLQYQQDSMTYYHYFFKLDNNDFLHTDFINLALENESLLYAVVGFAAYHRTLEQPDGKLSQFLDYYSRAVTLLRSSLEEGRSKTPATFLTILQLATFEEYLGDWVNLSGHHRAAHYLLLELYTPQTILETETSRQIFAWYSRFDVIAGLMAGHQTVLGREWYIEWQSYYEDQIDLEDIDVENSLAAASAAARLIGMDMASLFSQLPQGLISIQEFIVESEKIGQRILHLRERIEVLNDGYYTVLDFPDQQPLTSDDIVDPYRPGGLFRDSFWPLNHMWIDWYGIYQMYTLSTSTILQKPFPPEMEALSLDQCRIFEAIERWPDSPKGSLLGCHESLAIAAVFLKKDERHTMWCRRKMAIIEQKGYMVPPTFRIKLAEMWQLPEVHQWWLPNEEGRSQLVREIRGFSEQRTSVQSDESSEKLRDISAIFSGLEIQRQGHSS